MKKTKEKSLLSEPETPEKKNRKTNIPDKEVSFIALCRRVGTKWEEESWLTLLWMSCPNFLELTGSYEHSAKIKADEIANRQVTTQLLKSSDTKITKHISYLKQYLAEKYGKAQAISHYTRYGMIKTDRKYQFPIDRDKRSDSLKLACIALDEDGFADNKYGLTFWKEISEEYEKLLAASIASSRALSKQVGLVKKIKPDLKEALKSIAAVIRANYPKTKKSSLRTWGFLKERN